MDSHNLNDKIWFVYLGDHHEGPLSISEIQIKWDAGAINDQTFIWKEGMADWKPLAEVNEVFQSMKHQEPSMSQSMSQFTVTQEIPSQGFHLEERGEIPEIDSPKEDPSLKIESLAESVVSAQNVKSHFQPDRPIAIDRQQGPYNEATAVPTEGNVFKRTRDFNIGSWIKNLLLLAVIGGGGYYAYQNGYLSSLKYIPQNIPGSESIFQMLGEQINGLAITVSDKVPFLAKWLSPLPEFEGVAPEELTDLHAVAKMPLSQGPRIAYALSKTDLNNPNFYLTTNLPDGARFDFLLVGKPGTLLNTMEYLGSSNVLVNSKWGKSAPIFGMSSKTLPRGEFTVYVYEADLQPPAVNEALHRLTSSNVEIPLNGYREKIRSKKLVAIKTYFLGGAKDEAYYSRLNAYNKMLQDKADKEIQDLSGFAITLEKQYLATRETFLKLSKQKKTPKTQKEWLAFSNRWSQLTKNLVEQSNQWLKIENTQDLFYGPAFELVARVSQLLSSFHSFQAQYFLSKTVPNNYLQGYSEDLKVTLQEVEKLKGAVQQIRSLPKGQNGFPQKWKPTNTS